jgi:TRAP-type C4-dicarboxylate transport system substrate-binding protein
MAVSQDFLDSLPPDLKALTVAGIRQMADVQLEFNKGAEGRQTAVFVEGGGQMYVPTAEEMETFRAVKDPMRDWYVEQFGQEWFDRFANAAADCEASVDADLALWGSKG